MSDSPHSPRRQRKALYTAHTFQRRVRMTVPLSRELRGRFHARSLPIRKGDMVRVLSGSFAGREERVARVDRRGYVVTLDNVTLKTADEKMKPLSLSVGHLVITRLNLSDPWRRRSMRVRDEDVTPAERGEAVPEEEAEEAAAPAAPSPEAPTEETPAPSPTGAEGERAATEPEESPSETEEKEEAKAPAPPKAARRARSKPKKETEESS